MYLEDDWLYPTLENQRLIWRLNQNAENRIIQEHSSWTDELLRSNLLESTFQLGKSLGDNILVALSGGSDSQVACLALQQAGVPFTAAILVFDQEFNKDDVNSAINFCKVNDIKYITVDVEIIGFLARQMPTYVDKYQCPSPQICTHLWFFEQLIKNYNSSAIICGGNMPFMRDNKWNFGSTRAQSAWMTFKDVNNFNLIGNYRAYSFDIAVAFMMAHKNTITIQPDDEKRCPLHYASKIQGMYNLGFNIIPPAKKLTGFEEIKKMLNASVKGSLVFDRWYRRPHEKKYLNYPSKFELNKSIEDILTFSVENIKFPETCINIY
jgi:hypothetical protein